ATAGIRYNWRWYRAHRQVNLVTLRSNPLSVDCLDHVEIVRHTGISRCVGVSGFDIAGVSDQHGLATCRRSAENFITGDVRPAVIGRLPGKMRTVEISRAGKTGRFRWKRSRCVGV